MENLLYHYCSTEKAFSIIRGKNVRLSDITKSNDWLEMNIFYYNILQAINKTVYYKMIGFQEECEWRLYIDNPINKQLDGNKLIRMLGNNVE